MTPPITEVRILFYLINNIVFIVFAIVSFLLPTDDCESDCSSVCLIHRPVSSHDAFNPEPTTVASVSSRVTTIQEMVQHLVDSHEETEKRLDDIISNQNQRFDSIDSNLSRLRRRLHLLTSLDTRRNETLNNPGQNVVDNPGKFHCPSYVPTFRQ